MNRQTKIVLSITTAFILANNTYAKDITSLDTVTVTAQKSEEKVQDVPISISVFDELFIEDRNIADVVDIAKYTPGLDIIGRGKSIVYSPSIRGMYTDSSSIHPVMGLYVDGIPVTGSVGFDETLLDIQRVEVLKGPQGTLYGKNTEVGVINVITKKPDNETRGKIKATLGSDNKQELAFSTSGALIKDKFYIGITGKHYEKKGFVKNYNTGEIVDDREHDYGKVNLRYTPTDNLELSLISSLIKYDDGGQSGGLNSDKPREVGNDLDTYNRSSVFQNALNINYTINDKFSLSSTTTHRDYEQDNADDWDYTNNYSKRYHSYTKSTQETLSQELKLNYDFENIKLVSGLFYEKGDYHTDRIDDKYWLASPQSVIQDIATKTLGVFTHLDYTINDKLSLIGGIRFDKVQQSYEDSTQTINNDENEISPKLGLTYDISKELMTYLTIAKGYRSGGFNNYAPTGYAKTYDKESLYSYELGFKSASLDNRLNFDIALYYMDISDMQVDEYISASSRMKTNAAEATSKGIEASLNFQATENINLFSGASYNDIKFDKYNDGKGDYSGKTTTFAPKYNFNLGATYRSNNGYYASADIIGYGDMYLDSINKYKRDAYNLVNTKIGYEQENYDIYLYANNLFDKDYSMKGHYNGVYNYYSEPREIGIQLAYRF